MRKILGRSKLTGVYSRVESGKRLQQRDALKVAESRELFTLAEMANLLRERVNGDHAYLTSAREIVLTTSCAHRCSSCPIKRPRNKPGAVAFRRERLEKELETAAEDRCTSLILTSGVSKSVHLKALVELLEAARNALPTARIEAASPAHVHALAGQSGLSLRQVLSELKEAGLHALSCLCADAPSGQNASKYPERESPFQAWSEVVAAAAEVGVACNASALYGGRETPRQLVDHLLQVRDTQSKTGNIVAFTPVPCLLPDADAKDWLSPFASLRATALSRLVLANVDHIRVPAAVTGAEIAQMALMFGADATDCALGSRSCTPCREQAPTVERMEHLIREAGRQPVMHDGLFGACLERG